MNKGIPQPPFPSIAPLPHPASCWEGDSLQLPQSQAPSNQAVSTTLITSEKAPLQGEGTHEVGNWNPSFPPASPPSPMGTQSCGKSSPCSNHYQPEGDPDLWEDSRVDPRAASRSARPQRIPVSPEQGGGGRPGPAHPDSSPPVHPLPSLGEGVQRLRGSAALSAQGRRRAAPGGTCGCPAAGLARRPEVAGAELRQPSAAAARLARPPAVSLGLGSGPADSLRPPAALMSVEEEPAAEGLGTGRRGSAPGLGKGHWVGGEPLTQ
ncbi:hypothetical protein HPG69_008284, partial [Diceros bicornis minor]